MNELIKVDQQTIGQEVKQTVNARDLHQFLEVGRDFSNWIKGRINRFGFIKDVDYVIGENVSSPVLVSSKNKAHEAIDYFITLDMAKELSMVERNAKGKQARQYFIECEKQLKVPVFQIPTNFADALRLAANQTEQAERLKLENSSLKPKAEFCDKVTQSINALSLAEFAKTLDIGQNRLFRKLREEKLLMQDNMPYQEYITRGLFRVVENAYKDSKGEVKTYTRTLVTGKGQYWIQNKFFNQSGESHV
jgi:anti-repressor protein